MRNYVVLEDTCGMTGLAMMFHTSEDEMKRLRKEIEGKGNNRIIIGTNTTDIFHFILILSSFIFHLEPNALLQSIQSVHHFESDRTN
jgi:hypothetical protein